MKPTQTFSEACQYLNISGSSLLDLIHAGEVPAAKISKYWVMRTQDLDDYLSQKVREQTEQRREAIRSGAVARVMTEVSMVRGKRFTPPTLPELAC